MELPKEILEIIKEYSMPVTRGDWREIHTYTMERFESDLDKAYNKTISREYGYYYADDNIVIIPSHYILYLRALIHSRNGYKYNGNE